MANPWIFTEITAAMNGTPYIPPSLEDRWKLVRRHCAEEVESRGSGRPPCRA
jgi:tRNA-dihydrouridine synthase